MPSNRFLCVLLTAAVVGLLLSADVSSAQERADFTVVVLPDTQFYSQTYPDTYVSQTQWIKDRAKADNIKFVVHLGDIVQNYNNAEEEWKAADRAHRILDGVVPYSMVPGNHDMEYVNKKLLRDTRLYNKYFSPARFEEYPWYGGHMGDTNDSNYCLFEAAGMKFMVLGLEYAPRDETLEWAQQVVASHPECRVIVVTHCYMRPDGRDTACGTSYGLADNSGQDIWEKFVRKQAKVFMVVSGHVLGVATQTSENDAGRPVHEMLVDYQGLPNGGNGWLRTLRFVPAENKIYVKAYSPLLDEYKKDPPHTFVLDYDMAMPQAHADPAVTITEGDGKAIVRIDGQPFAEYVFRGHAKPILYPIIGPHGIEMTRNYPMKEDVDNEAHDHPHQKSLWYTHDDVNGVQFWMEYPRNSDQRPGRIVQNEIQIEGSGIRAKNDWVAPDGKIVCSDSRVVTFGTTPAGRFIDFQISLQASHGDVTFGDNKEGTMGIRTHPLLRLQNDERRGNHTAKGSAINSEGVEGKEIWGKRAKWVDYWGPINEKVVGIAIFDHPSNPRHPTWWHARYYGLVTANPFGIHAFEKKPEGTGDMRIPSGESVMFRYRFLFHTGDVKQANIAGEYESFAKTSPE